MKLKSLVLLGLGFVSAYAYADTANNNNNTAANISQQASAQQTAAAPASVLKTDMDKLSYTLGIEMGQQLKTQSVDIVPDMLARGLKDSLMGAPLLMSPQEMQQTLVAFQQKMMAKHESEFKAASTKNAQEGQAFLAKNAKTAGVLALPNGLQYKILNPGNGASPVDGDTVTVNYEGKFINGSVFDSSYQRNKPAIFPVAEVIQGWQQALKMMKPGAVWEIYVPANLAYGAQGMGNMIGPNQTLIFKINLISVQPKKA